MKYALLDSAILEGHRYFGLQNSIKSSSLFMGRTGELMDSVAPYLVQIKNENDFITWFVHTGLHDKGGVLVSSQSSFDDLHHHFRKFLYVHTEEKQKLYFRYYDPRILPTFLRTSTAEQLREFFGPVETFALFDSPKISIYFSRSKNKLFEKKTEFDESLYKVDPKVLYNIEEE